MTRRKWHRHNGGLVLCEGDTKLGSVSYGPWPGSIGWWWIGTLHEEALTQRFDYQSAARYWVERQVELAATADPATVRADEYGNDDLDGEGEQDAR